MEPAAGCIRLVAPAHREGGTGQTSVQPLTPRDAACADAHAAGVPAAVAVPVAYASLFPPKDADAEARRRWLATSPWPEVVFAAAV